MSLRFSLVFFNMFFDENLGKSTFSAKFVLASSSSKQSITLNGIPTSSFCSST